MRNPETGRFAPAGSIPLPVAPDNRYRPERRPVRAGLVADALCGALAAALTAALGAWVAATHDGSAAAAAREGVHAGAPAPPPATMPGVDIGELDAVAVWLAEMRRARVPKRLLAQYHAQITVESAWDERAVSPAGAQGLAQVMPRTGAEEFPALDPPCDAADAFDAACSARFQPHYRRRIRGWLPGDAKTDDLELAAYNMGIGAVKRRIDECRATPACDPQVWPTIAPRMARETRRYVRVIGQHERESGAWFGAEFRWEF